MLRKLCLLLSAAGCLSVCTLRADSIAALPGQTSAGTGVSVLTINPLGILNSFNAGDNAFVILPLPGGSKNYVVAKAPTSTIITVDNLFQNPKLVSSLQVAANDAALTPDGSKLVLIADTVHIFDTTKDQELVPGGISTGVNLIDMAISFDGKKAYVLGTSTAGGSQLNVIDLTTNTKANPSYAVLGTASGLAIGRNGRLYVSTRNQVIELDPNTLQPTTGGIIGVNAQPGPLVFTPDGKYALAVNQTPITGTAILVFDLNSHTVSTFVPNNNIVFDKLLVASSSTVFAYSSQAQSLYQLGIGSGGGIAINVATVGGVPNTFVNAVAISNEIPFAGNTTAHFLFVLQGTTLYRVDLTTSQLTAQAPLPNQQFNDLEYVALPSTNSPAVLLTYGDKQTLAPKANSLPLVVQALDTSGRPVTGATITFAANVNTASLNPTSVTTGANGFAETILTAPPTNGTVSVTATSGKLSPVAFTISVGSGTTPNAGSLIITTGQGQLLPENTNTSTGTFGSPLQVLLTDVNGKAVSGAAVTFTITDGRGSLSQIGATTIPNGVSIATNTQGLATVGFQTNVVDNGLGHSQTTITAKAAGTNTVTFYEITYPSAAPAPEPRFITPQFGDKVEGQAGTTLPAAFSAAFADTRGNPIPNVGMNTCIPQAPANPQTPPTCIVPPDNTLPFGSCVYPLGQGAPLSNASGIVSCDVALNGVVGSGIIGAKYGNGTITNGYVLKIDAGPPGAIMIVRGNNQTGKPGQPLPVALVAQVSDGFGNVLPFYTPVTWKVLDTGVPATLQNASSGTDANGNASTLVTLGSTAGVVIVQLTAGNASANFSLTITNPAAGIQKVSGDTQSALVGTQFAAPLIVKVTDSQGAAVNGAPVAFNVTSGQATVATPSTSTDTTGQASTTVSAGAGAGPIVVTASSGNFSVTFNLSSHLLGPQNIVFVNGASFKLQNHCVAPGCVAPGEVVTVQGSGFATGVQGVVSGINILGPLPTNLAGVTITFNGVAAPIFYVANVNGVESMTIQVPFETQVGTATVVLNGAGGGSANFNIPVQTYAPGVFTTTYGNQTILVAVRSDGSYVSPTNPAHQGETIYVFVTGLGQTTPAANTNQPGAGQAVTATVITGLNNAGVPHGTVTYATGLVGVYIVAVQVPQNAATGPNQPFGLILTDDAGNQYYGQSTYLPISQ